MKKKEILKDLKKKILLMSLYGSIQLTSLTGCSNEMECNIENEHIHQYITDDNLKKYISGEKEYKNGFHWTNIYTTNPEIINNVCKNDLCIVSENIDYINQVISNYPTKREAYIKEYIYGPYYGYGYCYGYNPITENYEYGFQYGLIYGYHYESSWKEIPLNEYVTETVRDYTYDFKFYKIDEDGNLISKNFENLDDIEEGYDYFINYNFVQKHISNSYHLNKEDFKNKTLKY